MKRQPYLFIRLFVSIYAARDCVRSLQSQPVTKATSSLHIELHVYCREQGAEESKFFQTFKSQHHLPSGAAARGLLVNRE